MTTGLEDLERRMISALDQITKGVEALPAPSEGFAQQGELLSALETEREARVQLEEQIERLNHDHAAALEAAAQEAQAALAASTRRAADAQAEALAKLDRDLEQLRAANDALRDSNAALRAANAAGLGDATLVNAALAAELEALQAARAADLAEMRAITDHLRPLIAQAAPSADGDA